MITVVPTSTDPKDRFPYGDHGHQKEMVLAFPPDPCIVFYTCWALQKWSFVVLCVIYIHVETQERQRLSTALYLTF